MTDREKLVEIVCQAMQEKDCIGHCNYPPCYKVQNVVDELIAHGVTVKEPNRPLSLAEARGRNRERLPLYMECKFTEMWHGIQPLNGWVVGLGWLRSWLAPDDNPSGFLEANYGVYWRCWAEKPTEGERKAAEWQS